MAKKRSSTSDWVVPALVAVATVVALMVAKSELGKGAAIGIAIASLIYVATVLFVRRGKIH